VREFSRKFRADAVGGEAAHLYEEALRGFSSAAVALLAPLAGTTFSHGLYRLYGSREIARWTTAVEEVFPAYKGRIRCFARDWLCNQFCLDASRKDGGEAQVLLFEVGTGDVFKIPATLLAFHESTLVEEADQALSAEFFSKWREENPLPLPPEVCVGYKTPLFLGGADEVDNLEPIDADVYWSIAGQLVREINTPR
jgi:hypothetical protein